MAADSSARVVLRDVAIVGGGCYGTFYAGQLIQARERGKAEYRRLLVIDRDPDCRFARELGPGDDRELVVEDWDRYFDRWLARDDDGAGDAIVPSPLMPHLMFAWLSRRARARWPGRLVEHRPLELDAETPYDVLAPDGTRYVSFADWLCPVHCIEPAICPVIRAPRSWEISDAAERLVERRARRPPVPCCSSAATGCTEWECSTSPRSWPATPPWPRPAPRPRSGWSWAPSRRAMGR